MRVFAGVRARVCVRNPVLLLALHSSHHPSSGLVSVSGEPRGGVKSGGTGENERKRRREERRGRGAVVTGEGGAVSMDRWTALSQHMWNHVSSFTAVKLEPNPSLCWPEPLFRTAHLSL